MVKQFTVFLALILTIKNFSQNTFVEGYFINNSNKKTTCLIKNEDRLNNPTEFKYKTDLNSKIKTLTINAVKEFGVLNVSKYERHNVGIDRSSKISDELDYDKNPIFKNEQLFLKVLIEGKANLYYYEDQGLVRFFFNKDSDEVRQLIIKHYLTDEGDFATNKEFRRQLWITLTCESISMNSLKRINYRKSDLIKFFIKYNECHNSEFVNYQKKQKNKDLFNLNIRPGIRSSSFVLVDPHRRQIDFGKNLTSFRLGLEAEFILGFNNNKWAFFLEPTYHQFNSDKQFKSDKLSASINQKSIEVNFGVRHYVYLKKDLKLFANALLIYVNNFNSQIDEQRFSFSAELNNTIYGSLGIGCKYKGRFSLEFRYLSSRDILISNPTWNTNFQSLSVVLGYSIFFYYI